ncbi:MAG TPA: glutamine--tRNA ligase/YqeY domain fusion protein [Polyangiaceae bacterium]|nr:glutamine--tRNA ligase/YqeY domain fusion protein [Polyangiaceae bacterium]
MAQNDSTEQNHRQSPDQPQNADFIRALIEDELHSGKHKTVISRFPPEPNGYLHIGHAKSICLNFGVAKQYGGTCHLRFDDTNPTTEDIEYVDSIQADVKWLGFDWGKNLFYASDYFDQIYDYALELIRRGKAYVCGLDDEQIRQYRGTISEAGQPSPDRDRSVEENLALFERMRKGEFPDGKYVLRAKIDMSNPNMKMRDPPIYRIRHKDHYRQGNKWCIYPLYDFTHCLSDSIERITHSLCTLEFENNRELYDWFLDQLPVPQPQPRQTEFARLNLTYTVLSKRKLLELVKDHHVSGWDDPRMPTIAGFRRRGYTPESIRNFCQRIGVAKNNSVVDVGVLEFSAREDLNPTAPRVMAVLHPLKVTLTNVAEGSAETLHAPYFPPDIGKPGDREVPFSKVIYIDREDFQEVPAKNFYRLAPGKAVRLRYSHVIRCEEVLKDAAGNVTELRCVTVPDGEEGSVKGTIQWVSAAHAVPATVRLYDRLFADPEPERGKDGPDFKTFLNPNSLVVVNGALLEPSLKKAHVGERYQFERLGFFYVDPDSKPGALVFNRIVSLKDSWAKETQKQQGGSIQPEQRRRAAAQAKAQEATGGVHEKKPLTEAAQVLMSQHSIGAEEALLISSDKSLIDFFISCVAQGASRSTTAKWIANELSRELKSGSLSTLKFGAAEFAELMQLIDSAAISGKMGKDILATLVASGGSPKRLVEQSGAQQITDPAVLNPTIAKVIASRADLADRYRAGNPGVLGALVGMVMKETQGRANPALVNELLKAALAKQ